MPEIEKQIRASDDGVSGKGSSIDDLNDLDEDENLFQGNLHPPEYYC